MDKFVVRKRVEEGEVTDSEVVTSEKNSLTQKEVIHVDATGVDNEACSSTSSTRVAKVHQRQKRSFQNTWTKRWAWVKYVPEKDSVLCNVCTKAIEDNLIHDYERLSKDSPFVYEGFSNWKKAVEKFSKHELSSLHYESTRGLASVAKNPITSMLSESAVQNQAIAKSVLGLFFRSIRYLGRQGLPLRGHRHHDGNLWQLMMERTESLPKAREWMLRRDNWMSDTIQNEILQMFGHEIQRHIISKVVESNFFGLTADGTTDTSGAEQFSCCLQFADSNLQTQNVFLGFYNPPDATSQSLFLCIKDIFTRFNLPLKNLQGYCFDGAANMSGLLNGVQAKLKAECPESLYVHCSNHALDLVLQELAKEVDLIADALSFVKDVSVLINESHKRKSLFQSLFGSNEVVRNLLGLCPTRWCIRAAALSRVLLAYPTLLETLSQLENDKSLRGETRAKISGLYRQSKQQRLYFGLLCSEAIFQPCESVAQSLQSKDSTARGTLQCVQILQERLQGLRAESSVQRLMTKVESCVSADLLQPLSSSRAAKTPARLRDTLVPESSPPHEHVKWRRQFFEALDLVEEELKRRFNQSDMQKAADRENVIIDSANCNFSSTEMEALEIPSIIDMSRLTLQLALLGDLTTGNRFTSVQAVAEFLLTLEVQTRSLFREVEKLVELCLCLPISAASAERSFSALKRLKTWLRCNMSQGRLTHTALMHVHSTVLDEIDLSNLLQKFISKTAERKATFGV